VLPVLVLVISSLALPCPVCRFGVGGCQIRPGDLQIEQGLAEGFVLGMQERQRVRFVLGPQTGLLLGGGVFAVENFVAPEEDESRFHNWFSESRNQSGSVAFVNASFGEFQRRISELWRVVTSHTVTLTNPLTVAIPILLTSSSIRSYEWRRGSESSFSHRRLQYKNA